MKVIKILIILLSIYLSAVLKAQSKQEIPILQIHPDSIEIEGNLKSFTAHMESIEGEPGLKILTLTLQSPTTEVPPAFAIKWDFPSVDVHGFWNPNLSVDRVNYYYNNVTSRAASVAPVISFYNNANINRLTIACSDGLNKISLDSYLREEDARFYCTIRFFSEKSPAIKSYQVQIRLDARPIAYYTALAQVTDWWASQENYQPAPVPESAKQPMYSTWYSFHQNLNVDEVVKECEIAKRLGFEAVIVDDGWQTLDNRRGYAYTGDWVPERIPDIKRFVDRIHNLEMNFILWYSLPFIGEKSKRFETFKGKYLYHWKEQGTYVLDPRYPEVREFIINTYKTALKDWNLDGFKLDFIGWFIAREETILEATEGRDFASVNYAVDHLMTEIMEQLRKEKPDVMIEFRQRYIGPLMRKYGNMFRAADCPNMSVINRVRTTDLRLLSGNTAVHSDMFMWHSNEHVEKAALQILNILFAVPQLSVRLVHIPEKHLKMVTFWINYWNENKKVLLDGKFEPMNPWALYPIIKSSRNQKTIIALYEDMVVRCDNNNLTQLDIVNAKATKSIVLELKKNWGSFTVQIYDCMGNRQEEKLINLNKGFYDFNVPPSGLLCLIRQ